MLQACRVCCFRNLVEGTKTSALDVVDQGQLNRKCGTVSGVILCVSVQCVAGWFLSRLGVNVFILVCECPCGCIVLICSCCEVVCFNQHFVTVQIFYAIFTRDCWCVCVCVGQISAADASLLWWRLVMSTMVVVEERRNPKCCTIFNAERQISWCASCVPMRKLLGKCWDCSFGVHFWCRLCVV